MNCAASEDNNISGVATGFYGADIGHTDFVYFNECFCFCSSHLSPCHQFSFELQTSRWTFPSIGTVILLGIILH